MNVIGGNAGSLGMGWNGLKTAVWRRVGDNRWFDWKKHHRQMPSWAQSISHEWSPHKMMIRSEKPPNQYLSPPSRMIRGCRKPFCCWTMHRPSSFIKFPSTIICYHSLNYPQHYFVFSWQWFINPWNVDAKSNSYFASIPEGGWRGCWCWRRRRWPPAWPASSVTQAPSSLRNTQRRWVGHTNFLVGIYRWQTLLYLL